MNVTECAAVVTKIQLGDNRQVDRLTLAEWFDSIGDLDYGDCIAAVSMHRKENPAYLVAAHVRTNAKRARDIRERTERRTRPAIEPPAITLDRARFDAETEAARNAARAARKPNNIDPISKEDY